MNNEEAFTLLEQELALFRDEPYADLVNRMSGRPLNIDRASPSGTNYQVEIEVFWEDRPGGNILVVGSIDDDGWRAFMPLNRSFIKAPDGSFVGE